MIHVLHAEDDPDFIHVIRGLFERDAPEMSLEFAATGAACLERMSRGGVDALLVDLVLPDTDGLHILAELARRGDPTPVVMISGQGQTELAVKALRAGAADCLDKTFSQCGQVVSIVRRLVERARSNPARDRPAAEPAHTRRVLLIEDSGLVRKRAEAFFAQGAFNLAVRAIGWPAGLDEGLPEADAIVVGSAPEDAKSLDLLRSLRSRWPEIPVILAGPPGDGESAVAAFKLGAQDYIFTREGFLDELAFSLANAINRAQLARRNAALTGELDALNRSLEAQVQARTRELESLSSRLIRVREEERRRIARELHDQIGQTLTGLKLELEAAAAGSPESMREKLAEALALAADLLARVREITLQLHPPVLDDLGLQAALEWHLKLYQRQTGIAVTAEYALPAARLAAELEMTIFRIVQEALTNAARHSGALAAEVTVISDATQVMVEVSDRGCGFEPGRVRTRADSLGLSGLVERARLAGGRLEIVSREGRGTRIQASFPLLFAGAP